MKFQTALRLALLPTLTSVCFGANLAFPVSGITNDTPLDGGWSQSDGAVAADKLAFYSTIASYYEGVSVGAYWDNYSGVGTDFTVGHATDAVAVGGATIDWHFVITPPSGLYSTALNDYTISLFDNAAVNVLTIQLDNIDSIHWNAAVNGHYMGVIESNGFYDLHTQFGATTGYFTSITGIGTISYTDTVSANTGSFLSVQVGTTQGTGANFGDGFITVVPEPSSTMLASLLPALLVLRRRR